MSILSKNSAFTYPAFTIQVSIAKCEPLSILEHTLCKNLNPAYLIAAFEQNMNDFHSRFSKESFWEGIASIRILKRVVSLVISMENNFAKFSTNSDISSSRNET
jgi:hypothetical protein